MYALYVTHPEVSIDPAVPVPQWSLSPEGEARARAFARHPLVKGVRNIVSSTERKAIELGQAMAVSARAPMVAEPDFDENDRSATGFVPPERFEQLADAFFAHPDESVEGWEPARQAQARIAGAVEAAIALHDISRPIAFAGHGGVGTLLKCYLAGRDISRAEDQGRLGNPKGGNVLVIRLSDLSLQGDWVPMEELAETLPF
jgi:broad specificity phosphatase PhoE